jgi:hypothetical protein
LRLQAASVSDRLTQHSQWKFQLKTSARAG